MSDKLKSVKSPRVKATRAPKRASAKTESLESLQHAYEDLRSKKPDGPGKAAWKIELKQVQGKIRALQKAR